MSAPAVNRTACPVCGTACRTIKSKQIAPTYREVTYVCPDPRCGHVFVAAITPVRTLEPSSLHEPITKVG